MVHQLVHTRNTHFIYIFIRQCCVFFFPHQEKVLVNQLVAFNCDPNTEYNEVASLFFRDADTAIRQVWIDIHA